MLHVLRRLRQEPGFTATALLTLAVGIGGTTAVFSVIHAAFVRALPFPAERIDFVWLSQAKAFGYEQWEFSFPTYRDVRAQNRSYEDLAAVRPKDVVLTGRGDAERLSAHFVSANLFRVLGVGAVVGRTFAADEDRHSKQYVTVISHGLWQRRFGGDPGIVGQALALDGASYTVIGVMPAGFRLRVPDSELWLPLLPAPIEEEDRGWSVLTVVGRRRPDVTREAARAELDMLLRRLEQQFSRAYKDWTVRLVPVRDQYYASIRGALWALFAAAGFVLAIGCVNLANLLMTRSVARRREIAIRSALGASRWAILRQLLAESLVLSVLGALVGLALAAWGARVIVSLAPAGSDFMLPDSVGVNGGVVGFAVALAVVTTIGFGLAPALAASRLDVSGTLKETERGSIGAQASRSQGLLVALETALALALAVGAALLLQTFLRLQRVPPGFVPQGVLTLRLIPAPEGTGSPQTDRVIAFWDELIREVESLPGVESAGAINYLPGYNEMTGVRIEKRPVPPPGQGLSGHFAVASPGYFRTMKVPLLLGRYFDERDHRDAPRVVLLGEATARQYFPNGEDPIGRRLAMNVIADDFSVWHEIVGVVGDVRDEGLAKPPLPQVYWCSRQDPDPPMNLVVRVKTEPTAIVSAVRARARAIRPDVPVFGVTTLERQVAQSLWIQRLSSVVAAAFAGVALALAGIGVYGVNSYSVERRTHEIGVRMALGAAPRGVRAMILRQGMRPVAWGLGAGLAGALAGSRVLASLLHGVAPTDAVTYVAAATFLCIVALASIWFPARRATRVDPVQALRHDR